MSDRMDIVDIPGVDTGAASRAAGDNSSRPYLSVRFDCCQVYLRIYRSADGKRYSGHCPRCGKAVNFLVGPGGTSSRFFVVS